MPTLFKALLSQHARHLKPMRYAEAMTAQLQNFFEEVVLENSLQALVIESLPLKRERSMREIERVRRIAGTARFAFFLTSPEDEFTTQFANQVDFTDFVLLPRSLDDETNERFVIIADAHFSALLTAIEEPDGGHQVIYTFDPDVIYTALEYLQARFSIEFPAQAGALIKAMHRSMPKSTSLHLTLSVTMKLASLWQEQTGREIAVNRIANEIRHSLELDQILQTAVNEVGAALDVKCCALLIESEDDQGLSVIYFRADFPDEDSNTVRSDLETFRQRLRNNPQNYVRNGFSRITPDGWNEHPQIVVPMMFIGQFVGVFFVQTDNASRVWQDSEILLLQTVADQVAVAIKHARLYVKSQQEALRDGLTGIFNRRFFELQFDRELRLAERKQTNFALVMVDIDKFKTINDTYGHTAGDRVLRFTSELLGDGLRAFDTLTRYGGEEFAILLPQTDAENAMLVAERLRLSLEKAMMPEVRRITASFGVAVYPLTGATMIDLLKAADKALYQAKRSGRNCVCLAEVETEADSLDLPDSPDEIINPPAIVAAAM